MSSSIPGLTFGSARSSYGNETRGDQRQTSSTNDTYGEVSMQGAYYPIHDQMPHVYRPINADYATKIAQCMITFCNNANVGYSQNINREGVVTNGPNTTTAINGDCSSTVRACIKWATGKDPGDFYTGNEGSALSNTGLFQYMGQYNTSMTLYNGDVLYGRTGDSGHTGIIVKGRPREGQAETELAGGVTTSGDAYDYASTGTVTVSINTDAIDQYVLTIDRNTPNPDYASMKKNRVGGVIIEAGYLYNSQHTVVSNPRNPYIQQQCKNAVSAGMPYGLYWDVKARTEDEAKSELYQLQFLIRKYPPVLGIWLHLQLTQSTSKNNKIVDVYAQELEILGLKDYKGFYVTAEELEKITWDDYQDDWWLWIVNHVEDTSQLDALLDPDFFTISGEPGSAAANPNYVAGALTSSGSSGSTGILSGSTNFEQVFNYFRTSGYSQQASAAICGNLGGEGGTDSNGDLVINSTEKGSGGGIGIVQWSKGRKTAFQNYASSVGDPWPGTSLKTQLDYMSMELTGNGASQVWVWPQYSGKKAWPTTYKGYTINQFKTMTDISLATGVFCAYYESCYYYNSNLSTRVQIANRVYNSYHS